MRRSWPVPVAFALVIVPVIVAMVLYARAADDAPSTDEPTNVNGDTSVRGEGVLRERCAEGDRDPFAEPDSGLSIDEARERMASLMSAPMPVPEPPGDGWAIRAERIILFEEVETEEGETDSRQLSDDAGAVTFEREGPVYVTVMFQRIERCELFFNEQTDGVSIGSASVNIRYATFNGSRTTGFDGNEEEFVHETIEGTFEVPQQPGLYVYLAIEWQEDLAPDDVAKLGELKQWSASVLAAAGVPQ